MSGLAVEASKCNAQEGKTAYNRLADVVGAKIILEFSINGQARLKMHQLQVNPRSMQVDP